jgi:hypothetical protein
LLGCNLKRDTYAFCFLIKALGWKLPYYVLDLFIGFRDIDNVHATACADPETICPTAAKPPTESTFSAIKASGDAHSETILAVPDPVWSRFTSSALFMA